MVTNNLPGSAFTDGENRLMIPLDLIVEYSDNPRDVIETDYRNSEFRILVENIVHTGGINHTPIQVYVKDGKYNLIAGHRRVAAIKKASELLLEEWQTNKSGQEPKEATHIYASVMGTPKDAFALRQMMFSAEETSKTWGDVRKYGFFRGMVDELPQTILNSPVDLFEEMRRATAMTPSTVKTYCSFYQNKALSDAMAEPETIRFPRSGRMKMLRACDRGVQLLTSEYPHLVRQLTDQKNESSTIAQRKLAGLFLDKTESYIRLRKQGELSVGPGVAMERTISEIRKPDAGNIAEDLEIAVWLKNSKEIFRQDIVEQTHRRSGVADSSKAMAHIKDLEIPNANSMKSMTVSELQSYADDYADCGDYFDDLAKKFRQAVRKRNDN